MSIILGKVLAKPAKFLILFILQQIPINPKTTMITFDTKNRYSSKVEWLAQKYRWNNLNFSYNN